MADLNLKKLIKELEAIEASLRYNGKEEASLDLHLLIVELLNETKKNSA